MRKFAHVFSTILCNVDMEQTGTVAGDALEAKVAAKKPRKPSISAADFVAKLKEASKRDKKPTAAELAAEIGMEKGSFDQRLNQLRNEWKEMVFVSAVKEGATAETLAMTVEAFDALVLEIKAADNWDSVPAGKVKGPFPFTLADGRSAREGGGAGHTAKNAILAALMEVDAE